MNIPFTYKTLVDWAGKQTVGEAEELVRRGVVLRADYEHPHITGAILWNNRELETGLRLISRTLVENECPCYANRERGIICAHSIAIALTLVKRATDPLRNEKYRNEMRRAARQAAIPQDAYLKRVTADTPGALPAAIELTVGPDYLDRFNAGIIPVACRLIADGIRHLPASIDRKTPLTFSRQDENLLFVLEDICEGPCRDLMEMSPADFLNILKLRAGNIVNIQGGPPLRIAAAPTSSCLTVAIDETTGSLELQINTEIPGSESAPDQMPLYMVHGREGWIIADGFVFQLDKVLPLPYQPIYDAPVTIQRPDVLRFMKHELPVLERCIKVESNLALDLFTIDPAVPAFKLVVRGSPASLAAILYATYNDIELIAGKPDARADFAVPDPDDLLRYTVRNMPAEKAAINKLAKLGLGGAYGDSLTDIVGKRHVLAFLGSAVPMLRRSGWRIELEGRVAPYFEEIEFVTPVVNISQPEDGAWFDVGYDFEDTGGASISAADVQRAIRCGESFIQQGDRTLLLDTNAIESMLDVFSDCCVTEGGQSGRFRLNSHYAPFVKSSLDALDGIDVENPPEWRQMADRSNRSARIEPVQLSEPLASMLRPYQKDGVAWLRFLERNGFCGLLADEMGLGKTIQTLAWLALERAESETGGRPALIICPTSLVENWREEAARFTPQLNVLTLQGQERHELWERLDDCDVAITSYSLLRRDLEKLEQREFSVIILDEAQHIKNRNTQNALAAKRLQATHRLVLTGTPVENSVADLWSIMDFLMPGYLGGHAIFRQNYELPIARGEDEGAAAQTRLRKKLQPFLLRRLKREVAKELPPKIEKLSYCQLTADQQVVYRTTLESSRQRISNMVNRQGFNKSRMDILATLMRLRQICCHLGLLDLPGIDPQQPSAKLDLFSELLDEAIDGGHRILVFSQFVSMLKILRSALEERGLDYCYLDGSTRERMQVVHRFNSNRDIPVFLISLKAGGTGLNLTGADMVVHFDPWWNPAVENQATDRAYRIGQQRTVYCHKLITRGTVEEKVLALQQRKQAIINATVENDQAVMEALGWDDIREIMEL